MSEKSTRIIFQHAVAQALWLLIGMKLFHVWQSWMWIEMTADLLTAFSTICLTIMNLFICMDRCYER
jgi:hypothetical protein